VRHHVYHSFLNFSIITSPPYYTVPAQSIPAESMSEKLIPLPHDHEQWIQTLFHVLADQNLTDSSSSSRTKSRIRVLTEQQYNIYWPLADGFWTHTSCEKPKHGKPIIRYYSCRLSKFRESSVAERFPAAENTSGKSRVTSFYAPQACKMKIKITESVPEISGTRKTFTIEQVIPRGPNGKKLADAEFQSIVHNHTIDESWKRKRCSFLTNIIRDELARGYSPAQVRDRLKGTGRAGGYERLESIGGAFVDRYLTKYIKTIDISHI
jgi:hypothetical protein